MTTSSKFSVVIRPMSADGADSPLDFAVELARAEGWLSETRSEFEGCYVYAPGGCLLAEVDGERAGICLAIPYGWAGFVGGLIVRPESRGHGVGRHLLDAAIAYLRAQGAQDIYLDGVPKAVPLYERAGLRKVCRSLRFSGVIAGREHAGVRRMRPADLEAVARLDRQAFGADRRFFLARRLAQSPEYALVLENERELAGFIFCRPVPGGFFVGPWIVSEGVTRPLDLLEELAAPFGSLHIAGLGVLEGNARAAAAIRALGLEERPNPPWRMVLGDSDRLGLSPYAWANGNATKG